MESFGILTEGGRDRNRPGYGVRDLLPVVRGAAEPARNADIT